MKKVLQLFFGILFFSAGFAQQKQTIQFVERENGTAVFGGMGIHLVAAPSLTDYINRIAISTQRADDFVTAVEFFGGIELPINEEWGIKAEHSYLFKSYDVAAGAAGNYQLNYDVHAPSILLQRVYSGKGYFFKISGGGGYHFAHGNEKLSIAGLDNNFSAKGIGMRFEINGQTAFDEYLFGYISGVTGWEFLGALADEQKNKPAFFNEQKRLNYFFAGLRFGLIYYF